jgi:hypothetical protein
MPPVARVAILTLTCFYMASCTSGPPPSYQRGILTTLDIAATFTSPLYIHDPVTIVARSLFGRGFENPSLTVHYPVDAPRVVLVSAVADPKPLDFTWFFPVQLSTDVELRLTVTFDQPGIYKIQGMAGGGYGAPIAPVISPLPLTVVVHDNQPPYLATPRSPSPITPVLATTPSPITSSGIPDAVASPAKL